MSESNNKKTRINKFEKRRKNTKAITLMLILGVLLIIILIGMLTLGGNDKDPVDKSTQAKIEENTKTDDKTAQEESTSVSEEEDSEKSDLEDEQHSGIEIEQVEYSDENVIEAYKGNWYPVMTEQSGSHTINYSKNSQDRLEMERAIRLATELEEDNMTTWWLENGGNDQTIATVSNNQETENYRVLIKWIDDQGWQPIKVEVLIKNDQKWRFE